MLVFIPVNVFLHTHIYMAALMVRLHKQRDVATLSSSLVNHKSLQYYIMRLKSATTNSRWKPNFGHNFLHLQSKTLSVFVCVYAGAGSYASGGINTQQQQAGGRILTRLCLPHTRVWSVGNLPTVNHGEATQVGNHQTAWLLVSVLRGIYFSVTRHQRQI